MIFWSHQKCHPRKYHRCSLKISLTAFRTISSELSFRKSLGVNISFYIKLSTLISRSRTSSGTQESPGSTSSAFSTLKSLITNKSSVPAVARQLSTFLPALLPGLARSQPPPVLPWLPPLEVELTEDPEPGLALDLASSSPDPEPGDLSSMSSADPALSISVSPSIEPGLDQIPSTISSLSPRSNRIIR